MGKVLPQVTKRTEPAPNPCQEVGGVGQSGQSAEHIKSQICDGIFLEQGGWIGDGMGVSLPRAEASEGFRQREGGARRTNENQADEGPYLDLRGFRIG